MTRDLLRRVPLRLGRGFFCAAVLLMAASQVPCATCPVRFGAPEYAAGFGPTSVATGDFNGDGKPDLAVVDSDNKVAVLLNRGDGSFGPPTFYPLGSKVNGVSAGDFNGDGKADVIVSGPGAVYVLPGNGDGTFGASIVSSGANGGEIAIGDFNRDGKLDIATAGFLGGVGVYRTVAVQLGNGDGTFRSPVTYPVGMGDISIAVADFNGDGKLDLVTANQGDPGNFRPEADVSVLLGNGDGTFQPELRYSTLGGQQSGRPYSVTVGDLNGDGSQDIAVADFFGYVSVLLGNGDGTFPVAVTYSVGNGLGVPAEPVFIRAADLNGDGKPDLAVVDTLGSRIAILIGKGNGVFTEFPHDANFTDFALGYGVGRIPSSAALADFDGDGILDVAVVNQADLDYSGQGTVSILLGRGDGTFRAPPIYPFVGPVAAGDFNGDGIPDLAMYGPGNTLVSFLGVGDGTLRFVGKAVSSPAPLVAADDFNGDGKDDLASPYGIFISNGDGTFQPFRQLVPGLILTGDSVVAADFDGDGRLDLATVTHESPNSTVSILRGRGDGTFDYLADYSVGNNASFLAVADFNGDGKPDLVTFGFLDNSVSVLLGNGDATFQTVSTTLPWAPHSLAAGDWNGDGRADLAIGSCNPTCGATTIFLGNGNGTFAEGATYPGANWPTVAADFNGDGYLDLGSGGTPGAGVLLLGNGDGTFQPPLKMLVGPKVTADLDRDGRIDFIGENYGVWLLRNSTPEVAILPANLPSATFGQSYSEPLSAPNGTPPFVFRLIEGSLPGGITLSSAGLLAGQPSATGDFRFRIEVTDASGCTGNRLYTFAVACPGAPVLAAGNNGPVCAGGTLQLTATTIAGASYLWSGPNGFSSTAQNPAIPNASAAASGTYGVTITISGCSATTHTTALVYASPSTSINVSASVCPGSDRNAATAPDALGGASYSWTIANGTITGGAGTRSITFIAGVSGSVALTLTIVDSHGCSSTGSISIPIAASCPSPVYFGGGIESRFITTGPDGNLWFTEGLSNSIARATPSGVITQFPVPTTNSFPVYITAGPDGNVWFTEINGRKAAKITPAGTITEYGGSIGAGIATGSDGNLWFGDVNGGNGNGLICRLSPTGTKTCFPLATPSATASNGIAAGPDGNLWFTERNANRIGRMTTSGVVTEFPIRTGTSQPFNIARGFDGALWFTEYFGNKIGRISTAGATTEFPIPTPASQPYDIALGPDGNMWFTEYQGAKIGRITPGGQITEFSIPAVGITTGPDQATWFTLLSGIGRLALSSGPPTGNSFYTLTPCRIVDTRNPAGPLGGPALIAGADRTFVLAGQCGIPTSAKAVSINVTITQPTALGDLRLYPGGATLPLVSTINYRPAQTRANNAVALLGAAGDLAVHCDQASGTVHFILDVNGYFQ